MNKFVHLHTHSHYSLLDGLSQIPELVKQAAYFEQPAMAISDHGNMHGAAEFYFECKKAGIKPILGLEAYLAPGGRTERLRVNGRAFTHITLLAENYVGYQNLLQLTTKSYTEGFYYKPRVDWDLLASHSKGVIALSGCMSSELAKEVLGGGDGLKTTGKLRAIYGRNLYLEVQRTGAEGQDVICEAYSRLSTHLHIPTVATNDCHYISSSDAGPHEALLCIGTGTHINDPGRFKFSSPEYYVRSGNEMAQLFKDNGDALANTLEIAERCNVELDLSIKSIHFPLPDGYTDSAALLHRMCEDAKLKVYWDEERAKRLKYELNTICMLGLADYVLCVWDYLLYAKNIGIAVGGGRGSSAGSIVCYLLGITSVDPIKFKLSFERFINPERVQPPDIDVDVEPSRRGEIIEYLKSKYGQNNVAQIATFGTMKTKQAIKDTARVLQLGYMTGENLSKEIPEIWVDKTLKDALELPGFQRQLRTMGNQEQFLTTVSRIEGKVRHASTHAAGVVVSQQDLTQCLPLFLSKDGLIASQYDMYALEKLGFAKFDILGLKNVAIIDQACKLASIKLEDIPFDDEQTFEMLRRGDTVGVFQYEGYNITKFVKEFQPRSLEDLIIINALYRPGPIDSGMARQYLQRRTSRGDSWRRSVHPAIAQVTKDTYGILVFQEQVMELARNFAGFSASRADILRRAMGKKDKELMHEVRNEFIKSAMDKTHTRVEAGSLFDQCETFARYGWNRAHSVVYGIVTYHTAYLKCQYPGQFYCATLNNEEDKDRQGFLVEYAKSDGVQVEEPHINVSTDRFELRDTILYKSLNSIKGVGQAACKAVIEERAKSMYTDSGDLRKRLPAKKLNSKVFNIMVDNLCFRSMEKSLFVDVSKCTSEQLSELQLTCTLIAGNSPLMLKYNGTIFKSGNGVTINPESISAIESIVGQKVKEVVC